MHTINFRFQRIAIVYVYMARQRFFVLIHLYDFFQQAVYAETGFADSGYNRCTYHPCQRYIVEPVAFLLKFIIHVQGNDHAGIHVNQLAGKI